MSGDGAPASAGAADNDAFAEGHAARIAEPRGRNVERAERLHEAETSRLVVAENMARRDAAGSGGEPDLLRLGDQVANGQDDSVLADQHGVPGPFRAQGRGGECVGRGPRGEADHGSKRPVEIEGVIAGLRLRNPRRLPVTFRVRHRELPTMLKVEFCQNRKALRQR